jgi:hypothetical protein
MFHCAGKEPDTGSAHAGDADNNMAASVSSHAFDDPQQEQRNSSRRIGSMQRFGQKNRPARIFLQRITHKTGSLICTQSSMIVIHDLKR